MSTYCGIYRKVADNMSFVGMHITNEGIIAFADSKSSLHYIDGREVEDIQRGPIQKLFKTTNMIIVTHGNNEVFSSENKMNIEDYMNTILTNEIDLEGFVTRFYKDLRDDRPEYNDGIYHFIVGTKENNRYCIYKVVININDDRFLKKKEFLTNTIYKGYVVGGNQKYIDIYNLHTFYHDIEINRYCKDIKRMVENLIILEDTMEDYIYNPVGLPVQIEIFQ